MSIFARDSEDDSGHGEITKMRGNEPNAQEQNFLAKGLSDDLAKGLSDEESTVPNLTQRLAEIVLK